MKQLFEVEMNILNIKSMNKNLLKSLIVVVIALGATVLAVYGFRGLTDKTLSPKETTLAFYSEWVNYQGNPLVDRVYRDSALLTSDFKNKVDDIINSFEIGGAYDPILCSQDIPTDIKVLDTSIEKDEATVITEHYFSGGNKIVEVDLVRNIDGWLINDIICNANNNQDNQVSANDKRLVEGYINENISSLSPEEAVLGGTFYVTSIRFTGPDTAIVDYEDGHIALTAVAKFTIENNAVEITSFNIQENSEASQDDKMLVENYIKENITSLSKEDAVLGGTFYVTSIRFTSSDTAIVDYEDGHIALTAVAKFMVTGDDVEITSFEIQDNQESNFSQIGNIVSTDNGWHLVYEKPGQPALREALTFTRDSKCTDETAEQSCFPNYWQNGDRVEVKGMMTASGVEVNIFRIISDDSQRISGGEFNRDTCLEQGGIIMFPDCVGCEPYCSYTEGNEVGETINDGPGDICVDMCGNGTCEEIVCLGEGCPCAESVESCPADCK